MIEFSKHIYPNGLTFLHHKDVSTPFVVVNVLYKVGARNEHKDRTGFAHLFEHLMFEGTTNLAHFDHPIQEAGGSNNAFTNNDFTNYYIKIPKENLELALWLEADRMQSLDINQDSLDNQKKVVIEEFKENYTNKPFGDVWHILRSVVYKDHPYQWPTIGKDYNHIEEASLNDVVEFYKTHYQPENAILSICGNVSEEEARNLSDKILGTIPNYSHSKPDISIEREQNEARFKEVRRDVPQDAVYIVFKMPERNSYEYYVADILSDILASGKSSRLKDKLITELNLFTKVDCYITGSIDKGMFAFEGSLRQGVTPEEGQKAIWTEINCIKDEVVSQFELEKVKNKLLTYMAFSENDLMNRSIGLCYHEMLGDAAKINNEEGKYIKVSAKDIREFSNKYFLEEKSSTLFYLRDNGNLKS